MSINTKNKVRVFFPNNDETAKNRKIHAVSYLHDDPRTFCGMVYDEWDCGWNYESRITDKVVTCQYCIDIIEEAHKFNKSDCGWN